MNMKVKDCMCSDPQFISKEDTVEDAAKKMKELDVGFLPVGDDDRLDGVITDRDIILRVIAEGRNPASVKAGDVLTDKVLYCFENDSVRDAARSMAEQQVTRLVVLNNPEMKRLRGIISLGDISRECQEPKLVGETEEGVKKEAA